MTHDSVCCGQLFADLFEGIALKLILSSATAGEAIIKPLPAFADPADLTGGNPGHQGVILYVAGDNGTCCNEGAAAYGVAADNRAVGAQRRTYAYERARVYAVNRKVRTRRIHVGEHAGGTAEHIILEGNPLIDRDVVLDPDTVSYPDVVAYVYVLPQRTIRSDYSPFLDVAEVPDLCAGAYLNAVIYVAALVNERFLHYRTSMLLRDSSARVTFFVSNMALACCCTKL